MKLRKLIEATIKDFVNENEENANKILDKVSQNGKESLTPDEKTYLEQYSDNDIDSDLEEWLFSDDDNTFDSNGNKLSFDGGYVWNLKKDDDFTGTFLYLGDDELVVIKRRLVDDEYYDQELKSITNSRELYKFLLSFIRNKK